VENFGGDLELKRLDLEWPSRLSRLNGGNSQVYITLLFLLVTRGHDYKLYKSHTIGTCSYLLCEQLNIWMKW